MQSNTKKLVTLILDPADGIGLLIFRPLFAIALLIQSWSLIKSDIFFKHLIKPDHLIGYHLTWQLPRPSDSIIYCLLVVITIAPIAMLFRRYFRISLLAYFLAFGYFFILDQSNYSNHFYLILLLSGLLLCFGKPVTKSIRTALVDRQYASIPAFMIWLLRFQWGVVYFYSGLIKFSSDWINGMPMARFTQALTTHSIIGPIAAQKTVILGLARMGLLLNLAIPFLLMFRRTRWHAIGLAIAFHVFNHHILFSRMTNHTIGIFQILAIISLVIFLDGDQIRAGFAKLVGIATRTQSIQLQIPISEKRLIKKTALIVLPLFIAIQLIVPLRIPIQNRFSDRPFYWTETGRLFSWTMITSGKAGYTTFTVRHDPTGTKWTINPLENVSRLQTRPIQLKPYYAVNYAHFLKQQFDKIGIQDVSVFADSSVSVNNRPPQPLFLSNINLLAVKPDTNPNLWISRLEPLKR